MNSSNGWGQEPGWASSFDDALNRYNGGSITPNIVQGFYQYEWAGTGRENIRASYAGGVNSGKGFNVSYGYGGNLEVPTVGNYFVTTVKMLENLKNGEGQSTAGYALSIALTTSAADGPIPIGDVIGGVILAGAATYDLTQRNYITYALTNPAGQTYIGRSSGYGNPYSIMWNRFNGHHMRIFGYGNPQLDKTAQGVWSYPAIRGREQQLIDFYGGIGSPNVGNFIRGVGPWNPAGFDYWTASNTYFGNIAPFTGYIRRY